GGEHRTEVVRGVVGLTLGQVGVHEVQVAGQSGVEEGRALGGGLPAADEGGLRCSAEVLQQAADGDHRLCVERADRYTQGVQHPDLELVQRFAAELIDAGFRDEVGQPVYLCHWWLPSARPVISWPANE